MSVHSSGRNHSVVPLTECCSAASRGAEELSGTLFVELADLRACLSGLGPLSLALARLGDEGAIRDQRPWRA